MIAKNKEVVAIKALQAVIIRGRTLAYEKAEYSKIADLLDGAEYLAALILEKEDRTEMFRSYLVEIAESHKCNMALTEFDQII